MTSRFCARSIGARLYAGHRQLRAFAVADELVLAVYKLTRNFPSDERFGPVSQLRRAAISIPSNIVEGCGRSTDTEYVRFLDIANGSAREVEYQLGLAIRLDFVTTEQASEATNAASEANRLLIGLVRSLRK